MAHVYLSVGAESHMLAGKQFMLRGNDRRPSLPTTRWQGRPRLLGTWASTRPTWRAWLGQPANEATTP